ncbi:hypothetical protein T265_01137 [Opisthorchis viverrini]|uniref:NOA36 protein n=1 Tax=Opisthorchis viverrini TaxID=6198 RepID=A0A075A0F9_OPIVI|nr:hypothetical protein T265_01137 [Opisthorchis viverrini]KER32846.1 hypothetical protein T265_01137 [Opisthorchis viverrini]
MQCLGQFAIHQRWLAENNLPEGGVPLSLVPKPEPSPTEHLHKKLDRLVGRLKLLEPRKAAKCMKRLIVQSQLMLRQNSNSHRTVSLWCWMATATNHSVVRRQTALFPVVSAASQLTLLIDGVNVIDFHITVIAAAMSPARCVEKIFRRVRQGAICDFCEGWVCHSSNCINTHCCGCPMRDAVCIECDRTWQEHGGRMFECAYCQRTLCEDDQFEHQASCQRLEAESYKCPSCNRLGSNTCLRCKVTFCDDHAKRKGVKYERGKAIPCPKCGHGLTDSYSLSVSTRSYEYGRQTCPDEDSDNEGNYYYSGFSSMADNRSSAEEDDPSTESDKTSTDESDKSDTETCGETVRLKQLELNAD